MATTELKSDALMDQMKQHLSTDTGKELTKKIGLVYQISIAPKKIGFDEVVYLVDLKKGDVTKGPCEGGKPDATLTFKDEEFIKVATRKMNPQLAFMRGAMKIKGSLSTAQKFTPTYSRSHQRCEFWREHSQERKEPEPLSKCILVSGSKTCLNFSRLVNQSKHFQ